MPGYQIPSISQWMGSNEKEAKVFPPLCYDCQKMLIATFITRVFAIILQWVKMKKMRNLQNRRRTKATTRTKCQVTFKVYCPTRGNNSKYCIIMVWSSSQFRCFPVWMNPNKCVCCIEWDTCMWASQSWCGDYRICQWIPRDWKLSFCSLMSLLCNLLGHRAIFWIWQDFNWCFLALTFWLGLILLVLCVLYNYDWQINFHVFWISFSL